MFSGQQGQSEQAEKKIGRAVIMFGSQSGNAGGLADSFSAELGKADFESPVVDMEDFADIDLTTESHLIIVTSTWGEGDPPDNAVEFWNRLCAPDHPRLESLNFAVCGLGDSNYLDFCGMGKKFDTRLDELGAKRIIDRADCDVDFEETAGAWCSELLAKLGSAPDGTPSVVSEPSVSAPTGYSKKNPFRAPLLKNLKLNADGSGRDTRHFEISLEGSGLSYEAGDALGVYPANCPLVAAELIEALGFSGEEPVITPAGEERLLRDALVHDFAITLPSKKLLAAFEERAGTKLEADYVCGREIIDFVTEFSDTKFSVTEFVSLLGKLQPRLYSISSSPKAHPGEVHLTVATVRYEAHGRERKGVCSTFLAERCNGEGARVFVHPSKYFRPPADPGAKMIMVGPGTGIAPFRAFLEDRRETGAPGGNWLLFGNPHRETDFLYRDEIMSMIEGGVLDRFDAAWSRDGAAKVYVQDRMRENAGELWRWLDEGAHFYVCGDAKRMAKGVDAVLHEVIASEGGLGDEGAADYVSTMKGEKRYQRDVY